MLIYGKVTNSQAYGKYSYTCFNFVTFSNKLWDDPKYIILKSIILLAIFEEIRLS